MPNDDDFRKQDGRCPVIRVDDGCRCILKADHEHSYAGPSHCFEAKPKLGPLRPAPKPDPEPSLQTDLRALSVVVTDIRALLTESVRSLTDIRRDMGEFLIRMPASIGAPETAEERDRVAQEAQDRIKAMEKMIQERLGRPDRDPQCGYWNEGGSRCYLPSGHSRVGPNNGHRC